MTTKNNHTSVVNDPASRQCTDMPKHYRGNLLCVILTTEGQEQKYLKNPFTLIRYLLELNEIGSQWLKQVIPPKKRWWQRGFITLISLLIGEKMKNTPLAFCLICLWHCVMFHLVFVSRVSTSEVKCETAASQLLLTWQTINCQTIHQNSQQNINQTEN